MNSRMIDSPSKGTPVSPPTIITSMANHIVERFNPLKIVLFGSRARGDARPGSDVDLLVVLPEEDNDRRHVVAILRELRDYPVAKDIVVTSPTELAEYADVCGHVLHYASRDAVTLYERPSCSLTSRVRSLNQPLAVPQ